LPFLYARKEVFEWLKTGRKTIDIRKGSPKRGEFAVFQSGPRVLRLRILKREEGRLPGLVNEQNYMRVIPTAKSAAEAVDYLRRLYGDCDGVFAAYHLELPRC
jgi:ASC-1-like (ASCH) protein